MNVQVGANVLTHTAHGVITVTLNRPGELNLIERNTRNELRKIFANIADDDQIRAVVISGDTSNFSVGGDISSLQDTTKETAIAYMQDISETVMAIARCNKPMFAAVEGRAAGAGIGLALLCDRIIASKKARFTFSSSRIGLGPDWGQSVTLKERVGRVLARKLFWEASKLDAQSARELGLIDHTCLPGSAQDQAWMEARIIAGKAPLAIQSAKCHYRYPLEQLQSALDLEASKQVECFMSEDFIEGLDAFRHRRRPDFSK